MKKNYPLRLTLLTLLIAGGMVAVYQGLIGAVLAFGILSALMILRQSEALYLIILVSFMLVFFDTMMSVGGGSMDMGLLLPVVLILVQLVALSKLSYICFGAIAGGGNYKKTGECLS